MTRNTTARKPAPAATRLRGMPTKTEQRLGRKLDAAPDRLDIRDWYYQPSLEPLPPELVNCQRVPEILNQGSEGACTGFALAAVINFLLAGQNRPFGVSPRMLYELARRYDEWPGEDYDGSSARGAMKAWLRHGVCTRSLWPDTLHGAGNYGSESMLASALQHPGGAYFRVKHREVRDMHAAINETGILYVTLMVHDGWDAPGPQTVSVQTVVRGRRSTLRLPVITRQGRAESGHAVAFVGYTRQGFIVQNSWGTNWGAGGFALLPYEDYLQNATDVWVAQLGVPVALDLWRGAGSAGAAAGLQRVARQIPLDEIRPYVIDVGNDGELSDSGDYWTTEADLQRLFQETIPKATAGWDKRRVLLYLHGGLNSEADAASRIVAMRDVMLANQIYPLHIMWESDFLSTLRNMLADLFREADQRAGGSLLYNLGEARDRVLELTLAKLGGALWGEMKENAQLASTHAQDLGAMQLVAKHVRAATQQKQLKQGAAWELHLVGHSAGSIFACHAMPILTSLGLPLCSVQFMAPAIRADLFKAALLPGIKKAELPTPSLYVLNDTLEQGDSVGPYGKSLLYLVSNAFEGMRGVPLLGMERCIQADAELAALAAGKVQGRPVLTVSQGSRLSATEMTAGITNGASASRTHGGFDNDPDTMNSVLTRILNHAPVCCFSERDLNT